MRGGRVSYLGPDDGAPNTSDAEIVDASGAGSVESVPWPADRDAIDIGSHYGDSSKSKRLLGWEPRTPFADGIRKTIDFYRARRSHYL